MNGPEHYTRAEMLLASATDAAGEDGHDRYLVTEAQAHATLAPAAAPAMPVKSLSPMRDLAEWRRATGDAS